MKKDPKNGASLQDSFVNVSPHFVSESVRNMPNSPLKCGSYWIASGDPIRVRLLPKASHPAVAGWGYFFAPLLKASLSPLRKKIAPQLSLRGFVGPTGFERTTINLSPSNDLFHPFESGPWSGPRFLWSVLASFASVYSTNKTKIFSLNEVTCNWPSLSDKCPRWQRALRNKITWNNSNCTKTP
jgi:hypothetical protein